MNDPVMNRNNRRQFAILLAFAVTSAACSTHAQDWPQYLGPNRNARVASFKVPKAWPKRFKQEWKVDVGDGVGTPALVGNRLYTFTREDPYEVVRCLDATSGKQLWEEKHEALAPTGGASNYPGPRSSPAMADGKVVTYGVRGTLSCLDAASGKVLWRKEGKGGAWPRFFTSSSPIILNGLCVAQLGNDKEGSISAFDLTTGDEKWIWKGDGAAYASPALMELGGSKLIIAQTTARMVALDSATGELAWETSFATTGRDTNSATPIIDGSTIIYAGASRGVIAVKLTKNGGKITGTELWSNRDNSVRFSSPMLSQGLVLGLNQDNELFCIDATTGKTAWATPIAPGGSQEAPVGGRRRRGPSGFGSVLEAGSVVMALTQSSDLIVFEPDAKSFVELARIKVADAPTLAYPIISGDRMFIKDQNSIALLNLD